jgi:hypothetical protein
VKSWRWLGDEGGGGGGLMKRRLGFFREKERGGEKTE